jgi:signal transduction histidine kinase
MGTKDISDSKAADGDAPRHQKMADTADFTRFNAIARTAALALDVTSACISTGEPPDGCIVGSHGVDAASVPRDFILREQAGSHGDLFVIEDSHQEADLGPATRFYASCSFEAPTRLAPAVICVMDARGRRFDERSQELLRGFALWAQSELNAMDRECKRVEAVNARLVGPAVHRMRGALTSIHGFSNFLLNQDCAPEQRREALGVIHDQASYLASLVSELVELMHLDIHAGRDFQFSSRPAEEILREASSAFDGGRVNLHVDEGLPPISADSEQLRKALLRLLGYAWDHSLDREGVDVSVTRAEEPGFLAISVNHRYRELSRLETGRLFEPFSRPDRDDLHGATNIGLALTKEIIDLHGGKALISEDRRQHRVTVSLLLPIQT